MHLSSLARNILSGLAVFLATSIVAPPAQAATFVVDRCSTNINGVYVPRLTTRIAGKDYIFVIGENGLTNGIAFNKQKAVAWVRAELGLGKMPGRYSACGDFYFERDFDR